MLQLNHLMRGLFWAWCLFIAAKAGTAFGQELNYLQYDKDLIPLSEYKARRDTLMKQMGPGTVALFYAAPERTRNGDVEYLYRQEDNFYYLTGCTEPNTLLLLSTDGFKVFAGAEDENGTLVHELLLVQPRDPQSEQWTGRRLGPEGAKALLGIEAALVNTNLATTLQQALYGNAAKVFYIPSFPTHLSGGIYDLLGPVRDMIDNIQARHLLIEFRDPTPMVFKLRIVKSPGEVALLTKATEISALAHNQAMMSCTPGMHEYELQAIYHYVHTRCGAEYVGYPCIVGAAENTIILHYNSNRKQIQNGEIVLADCAAEYHGYSSDVTRTYPANGSFSEPQREVYSIVLAAQNAAMAALKPGVNWKTVSAIADSVIEEGLFKLKLIHAKDKKSYRRFYMHGLGHPVGLNVHDVGQPVLEANMLYTVEPGIYIGAASDIPEAYRNIGVRIEDVVLITTDGHKNLSEGSPREIADIELLMKKKGIGDQPLK